MFEPLKFYCINNNDYRSFLAHMYKSTKSYRCDFDVGWVLASHFKVLHQSVVFYVMGKALSGKLSCTGLVKDIFLVYWVP